MSWFPKRGLQCRHVYRASEIYFICGLYDSMPFKLSHHISVYFQNLVQSLFGVLSVCMSRISLSVMQGLTLCTLANL